MGASLRPCQGVHGGRHESADFWLELTLFFAVVVVLVSHTQLEAAFPAELWPAPRLPRRT
jgi:hypothetical protein